MWMCVLCVGVSSSVRAQTTTVTQKSVNGTIVSVGGNRVLVKEADGLTSTVPGVQFR
jgi:hypothetical protein